MILLYIFFWYFFLFVVGFTISSNIKQKLKITRQNHNNKQRKTEIWQLIHSYFTTFIWINVHIHSYDHKNVWQIWRNVSSPYPYPYCEGRTPPPYLAMSLWREDTPSLPLNVPSHWHGEVGRECPPFPVRVGAGNIFDNDFWFDNKLIHFIMGDRQGGILADAILQICQMFSIGQYMAKAGVYLWMILCLVL